MKKVLLATSALVAAGFATNAMAAEWETGVSGYMIIGGALADNDTTGDVGVLRDGEFHIDAELTADNGLLFAAHIEVEAFTSGDQIDENWGAVAGSFGRVKIGGDDSSLASYHNGVIYAPAARIGYMDSFALTEAGGNLTQLGSNSDSIGFHYDTPNFSGFQVGLTYQPTLATDGGGDTNNPAFNGGPGTDDFYTIAANYNGDFGDFGLGVSGGYGDGSGGGNSIWNVGGYVDFSGFRLAGGYQDSNFFAESIGGAYAGQTYYVGAQYATGPWTVAGGYSNNTDTDVDVAAAWLTYALAPGVDTTVGVEYGDNGSNEDFGGLAFMRLRF